LIECFEREWRLVDDWCAILDRFIEQEREIERQNYRGLTVDEYQKKPHKEQQDAFRNPHKTQPDPAPSDGDLAIQRCERECKYAAGELR
jgi:hypothetical protein